MAQSFPNVQVFHLVDLDCLNWQWAWFWSRPLQKFEFYGRSQYLNIHKVIIYLITNKKNSHIVNCNVKFLKSHLLFAKLSADVIHFDVYSFYNKRRMGHILVNLPARNARIQSRRSFSLATVKYNVYCGIDRPGNWSSTSQYPIWKENPCSHEKKRLKYHH